MELVKIHTDKDFENAIVPEGQILTYISEVDGEIVTKYKDHEKTGIIAGSGNSSDENEKLVVAGYFINNEDGTVDFKSLDGNVEQVSEISIVNTGVDEPDYARSSVLDEPLTQTLTVTPTKEQQTFSSSDFGANTYYSTVTVNPIPAEYVATADATATALTIIKGETAYIKGEKVTGTYIEVSEDDVRVGVNFGANNTFGGEKMGRFTLDATAVAEDIAPGKTAYACGIKLTGAMTAKQAETYTPGTADITINSGVYLSGDQVIKGDSDLTASNIKSGVSIFNVSGTFTSDATASASDIAVGKTAYVNGSKIIGTAEGGGGGVNAVSTMWNTGDNKFVTSYPPCSTCQIPVRTEAQNWYVMDHKLYFSAGTDPIRKGSDINWEYAVTRIGSYSNDCLAIGDGKLYYVTKDGEPSCITPDLTGVTQVMEGDDGRYFFLCGEDIYVSFSEPNKYNKVDGVAVSKILNQRIRSLSDPCVLVITTEGDIAEISYNYDEDDEYGRPTGFVEVKHQANGDPFVNYFYVSPEENEGIMGYAGGYEFAFRSSGLWYRKISENSQPWTKAENAPDLIPTNWLGYCMAVAEERERYDEETDEYEIYYELWEDVISLHIDKDGALWALRADAKLVGESWDVDFQLNGVTFERIGEDSDWQYVPPIPPQGNIRASGFAQKGGKLILMWTEKVDSKQVIKWKEMEVSPLGRLICSYEWCCFFATDGAHVDMTCAGGSY